MLALNTRVNLTGDEMKAKYKKVILYNTWGMDKLHLLIVWLMMMFIGVGLANHH